MNLKHLSLTNFRCYEQLKIEFHPKLTVLVAINGEGKTSILDALRIGFWPYVSQFDLASTATRDPANTITIDDLRTVQMDAGVTKQMARQIPCELEVEAYFSGKNYKWMRKRDSETSGSRTLDGYGISQLTSSAKKLQKNIRNPDFAPQVLPMFGYYGTGRLWSHKRQTSSKKARDKVNQSIRTFAYRDCLDPASSFRQFEEWFSHAFKIAREQQIYALERGDSIKLEETNGYQLVAVVRKAVDEVLKPIGWHSLAYSEEHGQSLILTHNEQGVLKVNQLSDGIKNMLGLVADIAYRCALLNSHLGTAAADETTGLVMIDEVDMHLHPQWQQTVLDSLSKAFGKLQFIVTTHSPQVLTTVPSECIRVIDRGVLYAAPKGSQGAESSRLLKGIFNVDPRPPLQENTIKLKRYTELVYKDKWQELEAIELRAELDKIYANQEPKLIELDLYIENREWELSLEED